MKKLLIIAILALSIGCTENQRAKDMGGEMTIQLPRGEKLVNATFKDADLWYLTRPMKVDEQAETQILREDSTYGVWNGKVTFIESK